MICLSKRKGVLLEKFLDKIPDPQQDDGTDEGADDLAIPLGPEGTACSEFAEQPSAYHASEKADDYVPDEAAFLLDYEKTCERASGRSD